MFSGIVETIGEISYLTKKHDALYLTITPAMPFADLAVGDSVCVNGVCLTVTSFTPSSFDVTVVPETLRLTHLGNLALGAKVNLERALKVSSRIGGHYVQGHVDFVGEITSIEQDGKAAINVTINIPASHAKYIVKKGFVTVDGMSLTVTAVSSDAFSITVIPHTQLITTAHAYRMGTKVNIEVDILSKYVEKLMQVNKHEHV